jgi:hypothetical protein
MTAVEWLEKRFYFTKGQLIDIDFEQAKEMEQSNIKWVDFSDEKPKESDYYFVKGKKGTKACLYYNADKDEWEKGSNAHNHFADGYIYWLKEKDSN